MLNHLPSLPHASLSPFLFLIPLPSPRCSLSLRGTTEPVTCGQGQTLVLALCGESGPSLQARLFPGSGASLAQSAPHLHLLRSPQPPHCLPFLPAHLQTSTCPRFRSQRGRQCGWCRRPDALSGAPRTPCLPVAQLPVSPALASCLHWTSCLFSALSRLLGGQAGNALRRARGSPAHHTHAQKRRPPSVNSQGRQAPWQLLEERHPLNTHPTPEKRPQNSQPGRLPASDFCSSHLSSKIIS